MDQFHGSGALVELVRACVSSADHQALHEHVLPKVRRILGASTIVVEGRGSDGPTILFVDGLEVPPADLVTDEGRSVVLVPDAWRVLGVGHVVTQRLDGHAGILALGWPSAEDAAPVAAHLPVVLDLVAFTVSRLVAESDLRDLKARVDSAQHLASMGDYDWHIASDTNQWSDELYRIYGYEPQSFNPSYERFLANIHPDDRERIQGIHQAAYGTGEPYRMIERILRPTGELRYLSSNGEVIMDATGTPVRMRGTCIDVTDRILAEQERERVNERFRQLVDAAPEAVLVIDADDEIVQANQRSAEVLGSDPTGRRLGEFLPPGTEGGRAVGALGHEGQALVLDVVTVSFKESEQGDMTAVFLADATPRLEREAMATRLGESQQRRRQALEINDNVVQGLSAASYALDQGDHVTAQSYLTRTLLSARNMMDDLLEPTGLQIQPGDLIRTEPASLDSQATPDRATGVAPSQDGSLPRVLVVDDAEDIRMLLRLKLAHQGLYEVVGEAADGLEAVEQATALQPDLVLLDMAMPRMDGLQALPLIREAVPGARVIVLSGFNQRTMEQEALAAGAARYVVKGGPLQELLDLIATVLREG